MFFTRKVQFHAQALNYIKLGHKVSLYAPCVSLFFVKSNFIDSRYEKQRCNQAIVIC